MSEKRNLVIGGTSVAPGERVAIDLLAGKLYTHEPIYMPVTVVRGRRDGPVLFISAAIHGDELNGIEVVRRVLAMRGLSKLRGSLLAVPIVNVLGVVHQSRYLPDRRDLNRCFPGSAKGSLAARMANLFMHEVVSHATHGIDLHTGALHRSNLPQVRGRLENGEVQSLAEAFGAPVVVDSSIRDGSLRDAATERGIPVLIYEAGEALRFDETAIRIGVRGVVNVMRSLGMLPPAKRRPAKPFVVRSSSWVRAPASGIFRASAALGTEVARGQELGLLSDPFGSDTQPVTASTNGVIIGRANLPLVHEGEALYHIGELTRAAAAALAEEIQQQTQQDPELDQSPPIA